VKRGAPRPSAQPTKTELPPLKPGYRGVVRRFGVDLPVEQSTVVVTSLAISAYYEVVRLAEARWPSIGILLGSTRQPTYRADGSGTSAYHPGQHSGNDLTGL
jgi:hypothetical protein